MLKKTLPYSPFPLSPEPRVPSTFLGVILLLLLLTATACNTGPDQNKIAVDAFLEQEVADRLAVYQKILNQQCRDNVLEEAGKIADSILISEARLQRDSLGKPSKPTKPEKPELKHLKDSLRLDPLFRDTVERGGEGDGETR